MSRDRSSGESFSPRKTMPPWARHVLVADGSLLRHTRQHVRVAGRRRRAAARPATPVPSTRTSQRSRSGKGHASTFRERSRTGAEWVRAPTEMKSTPVSAIERAVSSVTPPEASSVARPADHGDRVADGVEVHVVQHDVRHAAGQRLFDHRESGALNHERQRLAPPLAHLRNCDRKRAGSGEVGVLEHRGVEQTHAVVRPAAAAYRVLLQRAPAGCRLAGVEDPAARCPLPRPRSCV